MKKIKILYPVNNLPFMEAVLKNRGMTHAEANKNLASVEPAQDMLDAMPASDRILESIKNGDFIVLYTDYDADGFGCAVIFVEFMKALGYTNYDVYHNDRSDGFGMNVDGVKYIMDLHPETKLIVTSDNGIVAFDAVDYCNDNGIDVVITDHHIPDESGRLPNAVAVVDPHRIDETCQFQDLCGTGVLFKVMSLVAYKYGISFKELNKILDIVAVATIADVVPLRGDNRVYAKYGLSLMSQDSRPQWTAFKHFGSTFEPMTSFSAKDVGFFVGPCINACSRMHGNLDEPLNAFINTPRDMVHENIQKLVKVNEVRKTIQKGRTAEAMEYVSTCNDKFIVVAMDSCEEGIVGLVAGNICNTAYRPTIVLSRDDHGNWKGSGRSILGIHIKEMLDVVNKTHPDVLVAYGGHSQACGLTVYDGKVDELRKALNDYCEETFPETLFIQQVVVDYVLKDPTELPMLYSQKNALEPFGCDFPEPVVMVKFKPEETRVVKDGKHLIFRYKGMEIISWNSGYHLEGHTVNDIEEVVAIGNIEKAATLNVQPEMLQIIFK